MPFWPPAPTPRPFTWHWAEKLRLFQRTARVRGHISGSGDRAAPWSLRFSMFALRPVIWFPLSKQIVQMFASKHSLQQNLKTIFQAWDIFLSLLDSAEAAMWHEVRRLGDSRAAWCHDGFTAEYQGESGRQCRSGRLKARTEIHK